MPNGTKWTQAQLNAHLKHVENGRGHKMSKYKNTKTEVDGIKFDSKREAAYYQKLKLGNHAGLIKDFWMQVRFDIIINSQFIGFYKADFVVDYFGEGYMVIDVKGVKTSAYSLKKKLIKAVYGIEIIEV